MADDVYESDVQALAELLAAQPGWSATDTARAALDLLISRETKRQDEFVEQQVAEANLLGMDITDKGLGIRVTMARQTAAGMVLAAKAMLDAHPGTENYVEQTVWDRHPETGEPLDRYIVTFHKPRGRSAHELRQAAERERDEALAALAEARADRATYGPEGTHPYLSWACWHALADGDETLHGYCQNKDGQAGPKIPARCKWCPSPCSCTCHGAGSEGATS